MLARIMAMTTVLVKMVATAVQQMMTTLPIFTFDLKCRTC